MTRAEMMRQVWAASEAKHENKDCTVKALTVATGLDYSTVHAAMAAAGRKPRRGASRDITAKAIKALGYKMEPVKFTARTAITIERDRAVQSGRFVIGMTRHLAALIDGKLVDWSTGRRKKVNGVYRVTPIEGWTPVTGIKLPKGSAKWQAFTKYTKHDQIKLI